MVAAWTRVGVRVAWVFSVSLQHRPRAVHLYFVLNRFRGALPDADWLLIQDAGTLQEFFQGLRDLIMPLRRPMPPESRVTICGVQAYPRNLIDIQKVLQSPVLTSLLNRHPEKGSALSHEALQR